MMLYITSLIFLNLPHKVQMHYVHFRSRGVLFFFFFVLGLFVCLFCFVLFFCLGRNFADDQCSTKESIYVIILVNVCLVCPCIFSEMIGPVLMKLCGWMQLSLGKCQFMFVWVSEAPKVKDD